MANKYRQAKVIGMLRKLGKQEKSPQAALVAIKILMRIEGMGEFIDGSKPSLDADVTIPADDPEPTITAEMLQGLLSDSPQTQQK